MASPLANGSVASPLSPSSDTTPGSQATSPADSGPHSNAFAAKTPVASQYWNAASPPVAVNGKVAIPHKSQMPAPAPVGPASKVYTIPPRPKPGRKPKEPAADDVRKEQNRAAQKKFRSKQNDKIQALTEELDQKNVTIVTLQAEVNNLNLALARANSQAEAARQQLLAYESQRVALKRRADETERQTKRSRLGSNGDMIMDIPFDRRPSGDADAAPGNPTPPYETEIDFTNYGQAAATDGDEGCGFCTNGDFCACTMKAKASTEPHLDAAPPATVPLKKRYHPAAPGSCEACQRDPEQARKCQELAQTSAYSQTPPTSGTMLAMKSGPNGLLNEDPPERTSCSDFLAKFRPLDNTQYRTIVGKLHTFPHMQRPGQEENARYRPAMDIDAREAAEALTSLAAKSDSR